MPDFKYGDVLKYSAHDLRSRSFPSFRFKFLSYVRHYDYHGRVCRCRRIDAGGRATEIAYRDAEAMVKCDA